MSIDDCFHRCLWAVANHVCQSIHRLLRERYCSDSRSGLWLCDLTDMILCSNDLLPDRDGLPAEVDITDRKPTELSDSYSCFQQQNAHIVESCVCSALLQKAKKIFLLGFCESRPLRVVVFDEVQLEREGIL